MLTLKVISFIFSVISVLFLLSCVNFGIRTNIDLSEASHSQSRTRKKNFTTKKKKKKSLSIVFSPPAGYLCHFSTWSKKVAIQLCFPIQKKKVTHANPSAPRPKTEFESQQESPMGSGHREPPTPTCYRRRSHHVASCFTGSIELRSAPLSTVDSDRR